MKTTFECHITIAPAFDRLEYLQGLAEEHGFKVANLVMASGERSERDMFMTAHGEDYSQIGYRALRFCLALKHVGFKLQRYKIEQVLVDSRYQSDPWKLLD